MSVELESSGSNLLAFLGSGLEAQSCMWPVARRLAMHIDYLWQADIADCCCFVTHYQFGGRVGEMASLNDCAQLSYFVPTCLLLVHD
jgi:hypothetical protein